MEHIAYRPYIGIDDLQRQYDFWTQATRDLPWCWKPTRSPDMFLRNPKFDPRSRYFAFDGEQLIGYMSFSGEGEFVSLGYPWVSAGYEGDVQETLYQFVYGYAASSDYGGRVFAQRVRSGWTKQIEFYQMKGFHVSGKAPIYVLDVEKADAEAAGDRSDMVLSPEFVFEQFEHVARKTSQFSEEDLAMLRTYYSSVDFDFSVRVVQGDESTAYFGVTIRKDTGFAEVNAAVLAPQQGHLFELCIRVILLRLRAAGVRHLGIQAGLAPDAGRLEALGFRHVCDEIMLMKQG